MIFFMVVNTRVFTCTVKVEGGIRIPVVLVCWRWNDSATLVLGCSLKRWGRNRKN